jgi:hypothetical protein
MKKLVFLLLILLIPAVTAQQKKPFENIKIGLLILAKQYYKDKEVHRAKILSTFLYAVDKANPQVTGLVNNIQERDPVTLRTRMMDDGLEFSKYVEEFTLSLKNPEHVASMSLLSTVINPNSKLEKNILKKSFLTTTNYYIELFPDSDEVEEPDMTMSATDASQKIMIHEMNYNPAEMLKSINHVNYLLRKTGVQIKLETEGMEETKQFISEQNDAEGYIVYEGPPDPEAPTKNIPVKGMSVLEFVRYLEHTTRLSFFVSDNESAIIIKEAQKGQRGRPQFMKRSTSLAAELRANFVKSRQTYEAKLFQIKGQISRVKDEGTFYLIEMDGFFVVKVDKKRLKEDSQEKIEKALAEYNKSKIPTLLKHLNVVVRGKLNIKSSRSAYINDCYSILADDNAYFYTK